MSETILYEVVDKVAVITLNRPDTRNSQDRPFLEALDDCWTRAAEDNDVSVILLKANGPHFSSGHDLERGFEGMDFQYPERGIAGQYQYEQSHYYGFSRKWRDNPKPSIAAVQGACIAAGLMLCWPCDLIIAAENAWFSDPTIMMGVAGVEYHGHTWEVGPRKAKEWLFTGGKITAEEAEKYGMVNRVVPLDELADSALELAKTIAQNDSFALSMAKRAVNQTLDVMGQQAAMQAVFDIHELQHASILATNGATNSITADIGQMKKKVKK